LGGGGARGNLGNGEGQLLERKINRGEAIARNLVESKSKDTLSIIDWEIRLWKVPAIDMVARRRFVE